jgi:peptidoglycan/xylan/chitin deacetylase (PgdA/CDA1 family)
MTDRVPVLITWDIDPNNHLNLKQKKQALQRAIELCVEFKIAATFFCVAEEAESYSEEFAEMKAAGHEIGSHGLTHGDEEEYDRMPESMQRTYIERATRLLEDHSGTAVTAFRGPRVKVSSITLRLLTEYGYLTDSSVCSQRLDFVSSNLINPGWIRAPRLPYHPHRESAFKRGNLDILEVPVSALVAPFISSLLYVLKLRVLKLLFRVLYTEACRTSKPIVYLAHPEEFGPQLWTPFKLSDLSPKNIQVHGLMLRKHLNEANPERRLSLNRHLFSYIAAFPGIQFMTMREYALQFSRSNVTDDWC